MEKESCRAGRGSFILFVVAGILFSSSLHSTDDTIPTKLMILDETAPPISNVRVAGDRIDFFAKYARYQYMNRAIPEATVSLTCDSLGVFGFPMACHPGRQWYYGSINTDRSLIDGFGVNYIPWSVHA